VVQLVNLLLARREREFIERQRQLGAPVFGRHDLDDTMLLAVALVQELYVAHGFRELFLGWVHFERVGKLGRVFASHGMEWGGGAGEDL